MPIEIRFSWRSWARLVVLVTAALLVGVVAFTPDAPWYVRLVCGVGFVGGLYITIDAVVFARSWRLSDRALHVPSLASRRREISGDDLAVELTGRRRPVIRVSGPRGSRLVAANPLVATVDLRRWFDAMPG